MQKANHIAFIMDGNRRWAKERNKSIKQGHINGSEKIEEIVDFLSQNDIKYATFYVFSTENWSREQSQVDDLMDLMRHYLKNNLQKIQKDKKFNIKFIGNITNLPNDIQLLIKDSEFDANRTTIIFAINYGSTDEIVRAVNKIKKNGDISISDLEKSLDTYGVPNPDIIVRTGGHRRLSNFLLLQGAYSELYFLDTLWPELSCSEVLEVVNDFNKNVIINIGK